METTNTSTVTPGRKIFYLPKRANQGGWDKLNELGALQTGQGDYNFHRCEVPTGWDLRPSTVSPFQKRLYDAEGDGGKLIAKVFYKPGSAGGGGSLHVFLSEDDPMLD